MSAFSANASCALYVRLVQEGPIPLDVELSCDAGQVLALVGPSGSGKSTVLRCISGLYHPAQGKVVCGGDCWLDSTRRVRFTPQRRRVGLLFQHFALFPHLSALDNVRLAVTCGSGSEKARRAHRLLEKVHLQGLESRFPAALSGGQQQRVALARALARDPTVLLLDEPFSAVDQVTRRKLRIEMLQLTRELNIPIVLVTHDLDEACMFAEKLCVLHNGRTLQAGSPHQVMRHPLNATVARLIDVRNLFEAQVTKQQQHRNLTRLDWCGYHLEAVFQPQFQVGEKVCWCIPATDVLLHRKIQPSRGIRENPVKGRISEMVTVAGVTNVIVNLQDHSKLKLYMDLPPHVVKRNIVQIGDHVGMSLLKNAIHLMPWQDIRSIQ
ncbi:MAG: ABC transporter ATP-binding protein [Pseudomonadota bacterium]